MKKKEKNLSPPRSPRLAPPRVTTSIQTQAPVHHQVVQSQHYTLSRQPHNLLVVIKITTASCVLAHHTDCALVCLIFSRSLYVLATEPAKKLSQRKLVTPENLKKRFASEAAAAMGFENARSQQRSCSCVLASVLPNNVVRPSMNEATGHANAHSGGR